MGSAISGIKGHDDTVNAAELVRQVAVAAGAGATAQATSRTAEIVYHRAIVKSALANSVSPAASMQALRELGVTGQ